MNERKPPLPSLATAFLSALILLAGCAKGASTINTMCAVDEDSCNGSLRQGSDRHSELRIVRQCLRDRKLLFERIVHLLVGFRLVQWPVRRVQYRALWRQLHHVHERPGLRQQRLLVAGLRSGIRPMFRRRVQHDQPGRALRDELHRL